MKIFSEFHTNSISQIIQFQYHNLFVICIAKNFIWTPKAISSIFRFLHSQILDFQTVVSQPNMISSYQNKCPFTNDFVVQSRIYVIEHIHWESNSKKT